jgi:hypothetical protein
MRKSTSLYPPVLVDRTAAGVVSQAGAVVLTETIRRVGLDRALSDGLAGWRLGGAVHDPGKVLLDLAVSLAIGGDCLADVGVLRAEPGLFGLVASDATVSRTVDRLAGDADRVLAAVGLVRAAVRHRVCRTAGEHSPAHQVSADRPLIVDLDATLVTAHSEKEQAAATYKRGYGFHPLLAFADHGAGGTGEPLAGLLRPGNAGSNTADDHIRVIADSLRQLPFGSRPGLRVMVRTDAAGCTHQVVDWLTRHRLKYSLGFGLNAEHARRIRDLPEQAWTAAYDPEGVERDGAWVADVTGILDLTGWPPGMRVLVRAERPHPGAQLSFTDLDGNRLTALATNTRPGQYAELELRHRRRARCEDRIRCAKDTGLTNFPLHEFNQNRIWHDRQRRQGSDVLGESAGCLDQILGRRQPPKPVGGRRDILSGQWPLPTGDRQPGTDPGAPERFDDTGEQRALAGQELSSGRRRRPDVERRVLVDRGAVDAVLADAVCLEQQTFPAVEH